jgi:hypothetical protein
MTVLDYSGVREDGRWLGRAGWSFFSLGIVLSLCAVAYVGAIVLVVIFYGLALEGM